MSSAKTVVILGLGYVGMRVFTELEGISNSN